MVCGIVQLKFVTQAKSGAAVRRFVSLTIIIFTALYLGCRKEPVAQRKFELIIGRRGHQMGEFNRPRGIFYDVPRDLLHVVDWDGRIQSFTRDGEVRGCWLMPEVKKGKPEDLCVTKEGTILVTDTHYSRIMEFTVTGKEIRRFGSYGGGKGQFIYPVGICMDDEENIYVSEYGDNNRVQKFTRKGRYLLSMGSFGNGKDQFQRPSGIAIGPDKNLYVTDGVNHRIQVFSLDGRHIRSIGKQGGKLGEFRYPYDVAFRGNEMLVLEFGGNRIQKMTLAGKGLETFGMPGSGDGQFASPWRFCVTTENEIYVSDTNNYRVVKVKF